MAYQRLRSYAFQGCPVVPRISFIRRTMSATLSSSSRKRCLSLARSAAAARLVATAYSSCRRWSSAPSLGLMMEWGWATNPSYSHQGHWTRIGRFKLRHYPGRASVGAMWQRRVGSLAIYCLFSKSHGINDLPPRQIWWLTVNRKGKICTQALEPAETELQLGRLKTLVHSEN